MGTMVVLRREGRGRGGAGWCCAYMYVIYTSGTFPNEVLSPDPLLLCTPRDENQLEQNKLEAPILLFHDACGKGRLPANGIATLVGLTVPAHRLSNSLTIYHFCL